MERKARGREWHKSRPGEFPNLTPEEREALVDQVDHDLARRIQFMTQRRRDEILSRIVTKPVR